MRILHLGWGYPPTYMFGGPVYYVHRLALEQIARGHDVTVACASDQDRDTMPPWAVGRAEHEGVPYVHVINRSAHMYRLGDPAGETLDPGAERAFLGILDAEAPDVLHIHNLVGLCMTLPRLARQRGVPVVMSLHNYWPLCPRVDLFQADRWACPGPQQADCGACLASDAPAAAYRARHAAAVASLGSCDRLSAVSTRVAEIYAEHGVPRELIEVERIGSDAASRLWRDIGHARVDDPAPARPAFVFFGSQVPNKGGHVILEALGLMRNADGYTFRFFGASGGPAYGATIRERLDALGPRAANVEMTGHYTQDELPALLGAADVAVLTPQWEDNGPQTVFESLGAGLPVVGTRMGGVPDVVHDGVNGFLVPPADPRALADVLDRIVDDPGVIPRLRRGITPPRTIAEHADALQRTYEEIAAARRPAPRVSVVLRTGDRRAELLRSMAALADATPDGAFELIVVDEGSRDGTRELLAAVEGDIRVLTRDAPAPAALALADSAAAARAPVACVVRLGAELRPGWLDRALAPGAPGGGIGPDGLPADPADAVVVPVTALADAGEAGRVAAMVLA
ncbi:MAG: glycosyltransferase [Actinomycetota bacterium]